MDIFDFIGMIVLPAKLSIFAQTSGTDEEI